MWHKMHIKVHIHLCEGANQGLGCQLTNPNQCPIKMTSPDFKTKQNILHFLYVPQHNPFLTVTGNVIGYNLPGYGNDERRRRCFIVLGALCLDNGTTETESIENNQAARFLAGSTDAFLQLSTSLNKSLSLVY